MECPRCMTTRGQRERNAAAHCIIMSEMNVCQRACTRRRWFLHIINMYTQASLYVSCVLRVCVCKSYISVCYPHSCTHAHVEFNIRTHVCVYTYNNNNHNNNNNNNTP